MKRLLLFIAFFLFLTKAISAQTKITDVFPSTPTNFVTDVANLFTNEEEQNMNNIALSVQKKLGGDIAVVTLPTIYDYQPYEVGMMIGRTWKVGGNGEIGTDQRNLGVVVLIVPRTAEHKGECFISTGRGAEGFITDGTAGAICGDNIPLFKQGNYAEATSNIVTTVANLMNDHVNPPPPPKPIDIPWGMLLIIACVVFIPLYIWYSMYQDMYQEKQEEIRKENQRLWEIENEKKQRKLEEERKIREQQQKEAEEKERIRWNSLTPEQQTAELEARRVLQEKLRKEQEEYDERRRKQQQEESSRRSSYGSYNGYRGGNYGGGGFGGFGGGGGFSGGGGGRSF